MLLTIDQLRPYEPRAICRDAQQFIIRELGDQGYADLDLANPLDTNIDLTQVLFSYYEALGAFYSDGDADDPRTDGRGEATELDDLTEAILRAAESEAAHDEMIEHEDLYLHNLNESYARYSENPLR